MPQNYFLHINFNYLYKITTNISAFQWHGLRFIGNPFKYDKEMWAKPYLWSIFLSLHKRE